jgi:hypothetical protein
VESRRGFLDPVTSEQEKIIEQHIHHDIHYASMKILYSFLTCNSIIRLKFKMENYLYCFGELNYNLGWFKEDSLVKAFNERADTGSFLCHSILPSFAFVAKFTPY